MDRIIREMENRYEEYYEKFGIFPDMKTEKNAD